MRILKNSITCFCLPVILGTILQEGSCHKGKPAPVINEQAERVATAGEDLRTGKHLNKEVKALPVETWGGQGVRLNVTEDGGILEYDCAHGTINQRFELGENGSFDLAGTHEDETGGPIGTVTAMNENGSVSASSKAHPARYTGTVSGSEMSLTVALTDIRRKVGTFRLARGVTRRLHKCQD
jgi:hypothetical protein